MIRALEMLFTPPVKVAIALSRLVAPTQRPRTRERRRGGERRRHER